ncbi:MAG: ADP-ribosylglycohydrolase family protein [Planctomycetota bacterium]
MTVPAHQPAPTDAFSSGDAPEWSRRATWVGGADLETEAVQAREEGRDLTELSATLERLLAVPKPDDTWFPHLGGGRDQRWQLEAEALMDAIQAAPIRADFPYDEPSDLPGIRAARPPQTADHPAADQARYETQLHAGWLGRVAGCLLGKSLEGHDRHSIRVMAEVTGNWPITDYLVRPDAEQTKRIAEHKPRKMPKPMAPGGYGGEIDGMIPDDDINYTILGHDLVERYGCDFRPLDVAEMWLTHLPMKATCTAERIAYRNLAAGILPPSTATHRNPCREWIGAQIRADYFGYANPGRSERAAEWAWRDASLSHVKNGIYGEMWVAAMLAVAFVEDEITAVLRGGLAQVPAQCRLAEAVEALIGFHAGGGSWEDAVAGIHGRWDELTHHGWCHTISNAEITTAALLWAGDDFEKLMGLSVMAGFDTDCNAATAGSVFGVMHGATKGAAAIPEKWAGPLNDHGQSNVASHQTFRIEALAAEMAATAVREGAFAEQSEGTS